MRLFFYPFLLGDEGVLGWGVVYREVMIVGFALEGAMLGVEFEI